MGVIRRPIIGVMGSSEHEHRDRAERLGRWVAEQGFHLLTGAGRGVMTAVSRGFSVVDGRLGLAIGIVPCAADDPCRAWPGYPNPWIEIPIYTHLYLGGTEGLEPMSRNHLNVLTSTVVIVLPGGPGTASEARLALQYGRPCVAFLTDRSELPGLPEQVPAKATLEEVAAFVLAAIERNT